MLTSEIEMIPTVPSFSQTCINNRQNKYAQQSHPLHPAPWVMYNIYAKWVEQSFPRPEGCHFLWYTIRWYVCGGGEVGLKRPFCFLDKMHLQKGGKIPKLTNPMLSLSEKFTLKWIYLPGAWLQASGDLTWLLPSSVPGRGVGAENRWCCHMANHCWEAVSMTTVHIPTYCLRDQEWNRIFENQVQCTGSHISVLYSPEPVWSTEGKKVLLWELHLGAYCPCWMRMLFVLTALLFPSQSQCKIKNHIYRSFGGIKFTWAPLPYNPFIHSFIYTLIQQILINCILCARHWAKLWGSHDESSRWSLLPVVCRVGTRHFGGTVRGYLSNCCITVEVRSLHGMCNSRPKLGRERPCWCKDA